MAGEREYWAFLSYSHTDTRVCEWLHAALERYRVPGHLVGRPCREGVVPRRLFPIFRDRDELPGSSELGKNLADALARSRYLIVLCSPAAARSRWVNEEIRQFKMQGGEGRILALILDGEPNAGDKPESGLLECFPPALKYRIADDGTLTDERVEPIAADIRPGKETRQHALLRLIAGLLGIAFDELRQRDRERRRRALAWRVAGATAFAVLLGTALSWNYRQERMQQLEELGREALMRDQPAQAAVFLAEAYRMGRDTPELRVMLGEAMRSVDMLASVHTEHADGVRHAEFSDDGTRLLATGRGGRVAMWRSDNGTPLLTLPADAGGRTARFLPGDKEVALVHDDGRMQVVDAKTGKPSREARAPEGFHPAPAAFETAADVALMRHGTAPGWEVWDLTAMTPLVRTDLRCDAGRATRARLYCLENSAGRTRLHLRTSGASGGEPPIKLSGIAEAWALDAAERTAAFAHADGRVEVVDLPSRRTLLEVRHPGGGHAIAFDAAGELLASGGITGGVLIWDVRSGELVGQLPAHTGRVRAVRFLGTTRNLATLGDDGALKVWNGFNGALLSGSQARHGTHAAIAVTADGDRLASYARSSPGRTPASENADPVLKVWDLDAAMALVSVGEGRTTDRILRSANGDRLAFLGPGSEMSPTWDLVHGRRLAPLPASEMAHGALSPTGEHLAGTTQVLDARTGKVLFRHGAGSDAPCCTSWQADGKRVAIGVPGKVEIWDVAGRNRLATVQLAASAPRSAFSPDGSRLAITTDAGATIVDPASGATLAEHQGHYGSIAWIEPSPDGTRFRIAGSTGIVDIDAASGSEAGRVALRHATVPASACGQRALAQPLVNGGLAVLDYANATPLHTLQQGGLNEGLQALDCNDRGEFYVTGSRSGAVILWSVASGKPLLRLAQHAKDVSVVGFRPMPKAGTGVPEKEHAARRYRALTPLRIFSAGKDGQAFVRQLDRETRNAAVVHRRIACRVPLQLADTTLVPREADVGACAGDRPW